MTAGNKPIRLAIIGGGAAGMMAAAEASRFPCDVTLFERNEKFGRKLGITGKGRCNVTNFCDIPAFLENVPTNPRFLYAALHAFSPTDTMAFFEKRGVPLKVERGNRVFPVSDRAADIVNALRHAMRCRVIHERVTELIRTDDIGITGVKTESGRSYAFDRIIVATGGKSYPVTGSDGDGYRFAEALGLKVIPPSPSLCPMETEEKWCRELMGLSLKNVSLRFTDRDSGKCVYSDFGEMMFTHFGVTGPMILSASSRLPGMRRGRYEAVLDLKPALDEKTLEKRLLSEISAMPNKNYGNLLHTLLPAKLVPVFVRLSGIPGDKKGNMITKEDRREIIRLLKGISFTISGFRPIEEAIVTKGGISVKEIDPKTMACKTVPGLYFAGEILDVDGYTGGFNLQIAFSTAVLAARSAGRPAE